MKRFLLAVALVVGLPLLGSAATENTSCDALLTGTKYAGGGYKCIYMVTTIATDTVTDGAFIKVPFRNVRSMSIEVHSPTATNCTFDDGIVVGSYSASATDAGHLVVYGTLDDDSPGAAPGNTTGVQVPEGQFIRPYVAVKNFDSGGTCTTTNAIDIIGIFQEDN